ncbi:MAG: hypothetical protein GX623_05925 [Clostridiales bacterium]|nr:hypothetical protein [Clostridiales bacterium]
MKRWLSKPRLRLAAVWVTVAAVLGASVLLSHLMDGAERRHALRLDFSFNAVTTQGEQAEKVLAGLPYPVRAYALFTPGQEDQALLGLLDRFQALTPKFTYSVENLVSNPLLANIPSSSLDDQAVTADSLILTCEATGRTRVLGAADYLEQSFDAASQSFQITGLRYEASIAEALVYLTRERVPGVMLLDGHGELGGQDTQAMEAFLKGHHFRVGRVNLMDGGSLDPQDVLLVLSPQKDLLPPELDAVAEFTGKGGAVFLTSDYGDPDSLPNFDALLRQMGISRKPGIVIADAEDAAAYIDSPLFLTPYMEMSEPTAPLIGAGQTRLRLPGARAFELLPDDRLTLYPLLTSGMAYRKDAKRAQQNPLPEEGDEKGQFTLAVLSDLAHPDGTHSRAVALGNTAILVDSWLHEVTYGAQFLLHMVSYLSPGEPIRLDIAPKTLVRPQLETRGAGLPLAIIILLPLLMPAIALPVILRRRRK